MNGQFEYDAEFVKQAALKKIEAIRAEPDADKRSVLLAEAQHFFLVHADKKLKEYQERERRSA